MFAIYTVFSYVDSRFSPMNQKVPEDSQNEHSPCRSTHQMSQVMPISSPSTVTNLWTVTSSPIQSLSRMDSNFGIMTSGMSASRHSPGHYSNLSVYQTPTGNMTLRNRVRKNFYGFKNLIHRITVSFILPCIIFALCSNVIRSVL